MGNWWNEIGWRMIQTNLREIDMKDINAKQFVKDLQEFDATVVLLNTAGIISSYKTGLKYHFQSEHLHGDSLREITEECHKAGIRVIARTDFSKIRRPVFEQHPEWAYRTVNGDIVDYYGNVHACLNAGFQQQYLFEIITEAVECVGVDGVFCNMGGFQVKDYSYNYYGICHCDSCKKRFRERFGLSLPHKEDMSDPVYRKYRVFKQECIQEHNDRLYHHVKKLNPELAVNGYDIVRMESNTEYRRPLPHWQFSASSNTRNIRGSGEVPVAISNCSVDFIGFFYRHVAVSPMMQELRLWQNIANLGGLDYYLIGRLDNHEDRTGYEAIKKVFRFHRTHEADLQGLKSRAEALLLREELFEDSTEDRGWVRALTENHILFDEIRANRAEKASFDKYRVVIVPDKKSISRALAEKLDRFAEGGGIVVCTGRSAMQDELFEDQEAPLTACLGVERVLYTRDDMVSSMLHLSNKDKEIFRQFTDSDVVAIGSLFAFAELNQEAEKWMRLIPPHQIGPPEQCYYTQITDIPGVSRYAYGKGYGVFIPWLPGDFFHEGGYDNTMRFLEGVLLGVCGLTNVAPKLSPMVEVTVAEKEGHVVVQLVNASGHFGTSFYAPLEIKDATITIEMMKRPNNIRTLMIPENAAYTYQDGMLSITVKSLRNYEAVIVAC